MKLSKQQVEAIVCSVAEKENIKIRSEAKKSETILRKEKLPLAKKYFAMYQALPTDLRKHLSPYDRVSEKSILDSLVSVDIKSFDKDSLRRKLILASIDSKDMDELKKKLNLTF